MHPAVPSPTRLPSGTDPVSTAAGMPAVAVPVQVSIAAKLDRGAVAGRTTGGEWIMRWVCPQSPPAIPVVSGTPADTGPGRNSQAGRA